MRSGMLWFSNDKDKTLWNKIEDASERYYKKFGIHPNICFVNPLDLGGKTKPNELKIDVRAKTTIVPNHVWIGIKENEYVPTA